MQSPVAKNGARGVMKSSFFKKFIAIIVFVVMLASVCACGGNGGRNPRLSAYMRERYAILRP